MNVSPSARELSIRALYSRQNISPSAITHVAQSTATGSLITAINAAIFVAGAWGHTSEILLIGWLFAVLLPSLYIHNRSLAALARPAPSRVSRRAWRRAIIFAGVFASPWAALPLLFLRGSGGIVEAQTIIVCAGMCAGGAFMLHRVPAAAATFFGSILVCFLAACLIFDAQEYWSLAFYTLPYSAYLVTITLTANETALERERNLDSATSALADLRDANLELDRMRTAAEHDALIDELTGLSNRRGLIREIERRERAQGDAESATAVFHIDLDRFKQINDTLGHPAGDFVLRHVAKVLRSESVEDEFIARIGGDEFVLLIDVTGRAETVETLAADLIAALRRPFDYDGEPCRSGASIGIDIARAGPSEKPLDLSRALTNADIALYRAKEAGRNRYEVFTACLREQVETQKSLGDDLITALERGDFTPAYQAQCLADGETLCGVEALARWRHPTRGELPPGVFLPIAERLGVTPLIDQIILEKALADLAAWDAAGLHVPRLAVNVSAARFRDPALLEAVSRLDIPRGRLSFEIVESVFSDEVEDSIRHALDQLDEMGVDIELDDFGTGHSSLVALLSLRPKRVKIARQLAAPIARSPRHRKLVASVVEIAKSLQIEVIAEGVETEAEARAAADVGCDKLQGYYYAKPVPADALLERFGPDAVQRRA